MIFQLYQLNAGKNITSKILERMFKKLLSIEGQSTPAVKEAAKKEKASKKQAKGSAV